MGLRTHIGILVDGTVVPCCLDYNGKLKLGNIFEEDIKTIINSPRAKKIKIGFLNNQKVEEMCQHCNFYDRIKNN
jgi:radical SAM protein with 4Fe4S-binding SPASM domain